MEEARTELRAELGAVLRDVETQLRLLRDFGLRQLAHRRTEVELAAPAPALAEPADRPPAAARPPAGRRTRPQAHLFAGPEPDRWPGEPAPPAGPPAPLPVEQAAEQLEALHRRIGDCTRCPLSRSRRSIVFGEGRANARLVLVGEGPGFEEDRTGRPFVGPAGQLLERILAAMGLDRQRVYICNVVKCRPPSNRTPSDEEMRTCGQFLDAQLAILRPRHILCLGGTAARYLLNTDRSMAKLRGRFFTHPASGARVMPTYHPAYLLRNEAAKRPVWQDVQRVMAEMQPGPQSEETSS